MSHPALALATIAAINRFEPHAEYQLRSEILNHRYWPDNSEMLIVLNKSGETMAYGRNMVELVDALEQLLAEVQP